MAIPTSNAEVKSTPEAPEAQKPVETPEVPAEETVVVDDNLEEFSEEEVDFLLAEDGEEPAPREEQVPEPKTEEPPAEEEPEPKPAEEEPEPSEPESEPPAEEPEPPAEEETPEIPEVPEKPEDTRTPEEVAEAVTKAREAAHEKLSEQFKMTEEQEDAFATNPSEVLAKMAADLYLDLYDSMMHSIQQQMPNMVGALMTQQTAVKSAEQAFYKAWPQLAKPEYRQTVDRIATTYRAQNPKAKNEDAIREIGAQAWVALRLPLDELLAMTKPADKAEETPAASAVEHVPAGTGAARRDAPKPKPTNEYEELAAEFIEEDL